MAAAADTTALPSFVCVDPASAATVTEAAAGVTMTINETAFSDMVAPPECDATVGWVYIGSPPEAPLSHNTPRNPANGGDERDERGEGASAGGPPGATSAAVTTEDPRRATQPEALPPPPSSAAATRNSSHEAVAQQRERRRNVAQSEEGMHLDGAAASYSPSAPAPAAVASGVVCTSTSTPSLTTPARSSPPSGDGNNDAGLFAMQMSGVSALSTTALSSGTPDAISTVLALDRHMDGLRQHPSWVAAMEAAKTHVFVEGEGGRPVTSRKNRNVVVASPGISPLKTQPSPSNEKLQRRTPPKREEEKISVEKSGGEDDEGLYGMLDVYMWYPKSQPEVTEIVVTPTAAATPMANTITTTTTDLRQSTIASAGTDNEASLLMASATSGVRPSLATTVTVYALPGEDRGLMLTSLVEASAGTPEPITEEAKLLEKLQPCPTRLGPQEATAGGEEEDDDLRCVGTLSTSLPKQRRAPVEQSLQKEGEMERARSEGTYVAQHSSTAKEAPPSPATESRRKQFSPLIASALAAAITNAGRAAAVSAADGGSFGVGGTAEQNAGERERLARDERISTEGVNPTGEGTPHRTALHETDARPTTSYMCFRSKASAAAAAKAVNRAEALGVSASSSTQSAARSAPSPVAADARRDSRGVGGRHRFHLRNGEADEVTEAFSSKAATAPPASSEFTESSLGFSSAGPSPLRYEHHQEQQQHEQKDLVYSSMLETVSPVRVDREGVYDARASLLLSSTGHGDSNEANTGRDDRHTTTGVHPLPVGGVPLSHPEVPEGDGAAGGAAVHRGSRNGPTRRSATFRNTDLSAPAGLSAAKPVHNVLEENRRVRETKARAVVRGVSRRSPPPSLPSATAPPSRATPGELSEVLKQHRQQPTTAAAAGLSSSSSSGSGGGHALADRRRSSEASGYTDSVNSQSRFMARPGAPSPAASPTHSVHVSSPCSSPTQKARQRCSPTLFTSQPTGSETAKGAVESSAGASTASIGASAAATAESHDSLPNKHREHAPATSANGETSCSVSTLSRPHPPPAATPANTTTIKAAPLYALPALSVARPFMADAVLPKQNSDGSNKQREELRPRRPNSNGCQSLRLGGTSVLTTGQYRVWGSSESCQIAPTRRVASASARDGFRQLGSSLFWNSGGALSAPAAVSLPSPTHLAPR
ncbi:hypothetical protein ABB37_05719 [Leptomonas pyrrhocoris]|uniref:Uncharacterized protein n=1 Tax=Leptomonas pyrrhocoris TaxID=157538 RepID=A0A0N0DUP4_LEPPY|nr:hypothetical protein ABB37_05719 [Leptomonas pyrrhocoris]KPA79238.1 hypothetical protein ABB37_05719 [Leptomonas pyrrhocoris]|eukprot:XP_015657677.1 hypothetical protein ABB37_05719 [Leptomonas pyrrhocoris]